MVAGAAELSIYTFIIAVHQLNQFPANMACSKWFDIGQLIQNRLIIFHKTDNPTEVINDTVYAEVAQMFKGSSIRSQVIII